jgi:WS/DGAT/MGAT family acyltransferase
MSEQLSMLDTMFLELEQADDAAHMHIGAALVFDPPAGVPVPTIEELRADLGDRLGALPRFAQRLSDVHAGPLTWLTWEPAGPFDPGAHVRHATLPSPGDAAELRDWLGDFWSHRLDRHRPLWEMVLLDGLAGGAWALVTKTHHCLVDGVGSIDVAHLLLDAAAETAPRAPVPLPAGEPADGGRFWASPGLLLRGVRAGAGAARHPRRTLEQARAAAELVVREEVIPAPTTSLNRPLTGARRYAAVRFDLADLKAVRERRGGTINDVVLALCAGGVRRLLLARGETPPAGGVRAQVPVNVRASGHEHALGNELTSLFVELPVDEADPLIRYERLRLRAQAHKAGPERTGGRAIVGLADLGPPLAGGLVARAMFGTARMFNLTVTNVPGPRERFYAFGSPLVDVLPLVPLFSGHTVGIAVVSYAGGIEFGLNADRVAVPDLDVLADGIRLSLGELGGRGRRAPVSAGAPAPAA